MKKNISLLLSVLMVISVFSFSFNAFADQTEIYTDSNLTVGDTVDIPVYIKNGTDVLGFGFEVYYNSEVLSPISVTKSELINNGSFDDSIDTDKYSNPFRVVWAGTSALNSDGAIFIIKFSVIGNAKTNVNIQAMPNDTYDKDYNKVSVSQLKVEIAKKCNHNYTETIVKDATCGTEGIKKFECSICGDTYTEKIPATGKHNYDKGVITKEAIPTATGVKTYTCTVCGATKTETIAKTAKYANTLTVKAKKPTVKYSKLKKKNQTIAVKNAMTVSKAKGTVTYTKSSGNKKITINKKTGKITVKKGLKKGTYKVKVKVKAAGNTTYKATTKIVTVTIKVK